MVQESKRFWKRGKGNKKGRGDKECTGSRRGKLETRAGARKTRKMM